METSQLKKKVKSRGHWVIILEPLGSKEVVSEIHPMDRYKILSDQAVRYRGWPTPYFPKENSLDNQKEDLEMSENITGGIDWEHYKEVFTLFNSGQFVLISGVSEDWIDESEGLQLSEMRDYKNKKILSFVSTTYYFTEVFAFISNLINSDLYSEVDDFIFNFYLKNTKDRTLKIFGAKRVEFSRDYTATTQSIKIYRDKITKEDFTGKWKDKLLDKSINFYKYFIGYEPNPKVIQSDIDNLLNRRF